MNLQVKVVSNPDELIAVIALRFEILRQPWNQSEASASDELESSSVNAFICNQQNEVLATGRLQKNAGDIGQIRYMAVKNDQQGKGLGKKILTFLEVEAAKQNILTIQLQARENAVSFYEMQGYKIVEPSFLLWGQIQHFLMEKNIGAKG